MTANNFVPRTRFPGWTAKKCTKKHDARAALLFWLLNLLLFWRSRCRRRRRIFRSLLFRAANAFRVTWSWRVRHRNALTEIAWEDAVQGLGMAMSTVASEKNREMLFVGNVFYKQWHLCVLFHSCFEGTTTGKLQILIPSKKPHFQVLLKALRLTCVRESH